MGLVSSCGGEMAIASNKWESIKSEMSYMLLTIETACPECGRKMSEQEVEKGWSKNPKNETTTCPDCSHAFVASMKAINDATDESILLPYIGVEQLFYRIEHLYITTRRKVLGELYLFQHHKTVLYNMVIHFRTYRLGLHAYNRRVRLTY